MSAITNPTSASSAEALAAALADLEEPVGRLVDSSRRNFQNPYDAVDWPDAVDPEAEWFFSPELSSLHGTDAWDELDEAGQRRVTFQEAVNFFSLNIHGERELMRGLVARLYRPDLATVAPYLHHFVDEENKHSYYFGTFCERYGQVYRSRQIGVGGGDLETTGEADLRFFAKVLIFEEIVDRFNLVMARDERLHPLARFINHNHHAEEARHLIFGRRMVEALWKAHGPTFSEDQVKGLRAYLVQFYAMTWREYYNPDVYRGLGFDSPWELAETAWDCRAQKDLRQAVSRRSARFLIDCGLLTEDSYVTP
jgi:hypothetical protein